MAHKVKIKEMSYRKSDGTLSATKREYRVRCKSRGKVCLDAVYASRIVAEEVKRDHHFKIVLRNQLRHTSPQYTENMKDFRMKGAPTPKRPKVIQYFGEKYFSMVGVPAQRKKQSNGPDDHIHGPGTHKNAGKVVIRR